MNRQNFIQLGGFPTTTQTLDWMQTAYSLFNSLGEAIGNYGIIQGCVVTGPNISDGVVYVNGEIYAFKGGALQETVKILETKTSRVFEDGDTQDVHFERYVTFASGTGAINWTEFKRPENLLELSRRILPPGTNPQMYCGNVANIPLGWQLCDGTNGTPNLKGRFIVGYDPADVDYDAIGKIGGSKDAVVVAHNHSLTDPGHSHSIDGLFRSGVMTDDAYVNAGGEGNDDTAQLGGSSSNQPTIDSAVTGITLASSGVSGEKKNLPPYYTLAYIIYVG